VLEECAFAADGEAALPGTGALGAPTTLVIEDCAGLHALPAPLWRLPRLRGLHWCRAAGAAAPPAALPPAAAFASLAVLSLAPPASWRRRAWRASTCATAALSCCPPGSAV